MVFLYSLIAMVAYLPPLAAVITGFVLLSKNRSRLGPRRARFANLGLTAFTLFAGLSLVQVIAAPLVTSSLGLQSIHIYTVINGLFDVVRYLAVSAGIVLLVVAAVSRDDDMPRY